APPVGRLASRYPPDHSSSNHFSSDDSSSDYPLDSLSGYSLNTSLVPIATPVPGALSPVRADLLPPRKRIRGSVSATDYEVSSEESYEPYTEPDIDSDVQADIDACIAAADAAAARETDVRVEVGIETEAEAGEEANAEIQPEGTIEIGVDVTTGIDIPDDLLMPDAIEEQEGRNLIANGKRSGLLERVVALEGSNTRLRDALGIKRVRADSLRRRLGYVEDELRQVHELRAHESQRLWRMETFMMRTQDYRP
ncbi:hypothetical protein Tco_1565799, partial [Tanacetum coccineum]